MHPTVIVLACLAGAGHAQRSQRRRHLGADKDSLASFLLAVATATSRQFERGRPDGVSRSSNARRLPSTPLMKVPSIDFAELDGKELQIGIIKARQNSKAVDELVAAVKGALTECGVDPEKVVEADVPTFFELPFGARLLALSKRVEVVVPVGLIEPDSGASKESVQTVMNALMNIVLQTNVPVVNGVTSETRDTKELGAQWGKTAVEMAMFKKNLSGGKKKVFLGFSAEAEGVLGEEAESESKSTPFKGF